MRLLSVMMITALFTLLMIGIPAMPLVAHAANTPVDPCALLTQSDASGVMSVTSRGPDRRLSSACTYTSSQDASTGTKHAAPHYTTVVIRRISPVFFGALARMGAKPISGLGDAAYSYNDSIYVEKGDTIVNITISASPPREDLDQAELNLAKIAVGRM